MRRLGGRATVLFLSGAGVTYAILFSMLNLVHYNTFRAATFGLGIMPRVIWNTVFYNERSGAEWVEEGTFCMR